MKRISLLFAALLLVFANTVFGAVSYSGGSGTDLDPYKIANVADLIKLSNTTADWATGKYFIQTADIDADSASTLNGGEGFSPIGNITTRFSGNYNGQSHTISDLVINRDTNDYIGLFGYTVGATISNLGLLNVNIKGFWFVGSLVGFGRASTNISNCYSISSVLGTGDVVGGFVGAIENNSTINNCYCISNVDGKGNYVGGFIGNSINTSTISNCFCTSNVEGIEKVGGFIGNNENTSTISYSYSTGDVIGTDDVGGFIGRNSGSSKVSDCFSHSTVTRSGGLEIGFGGFVGLNSDPNIIENCYSIGSVSYANADPTLQTNNGFTGGGNGTYTKCFWDKEKSGSLGSKGFPIIGKNSTEMKTEATFTEAGWDFGTDASNWIMSSPAAFGGYPTFIWTDGYSVEPTGTPREIATLQNLLWLAENSTRWDGSYIQTANIKTFTSSSWGFSMGWTPIGDAVTNFSGSYNGGGKFISNLYINHSSGSYIGLFGFISGATVSNLGLLNVHFTGNNYVGGLVGYNDGTSTISSSFCTGSINGIDYVGGLVGYNDGSSTIKNSYSTCSVTRSSGSNTNFGGFCGHSKFSTIEYCYSIGEVYSSASVIWNEGDNKDKGFVGSINGGTYTNNFFNSETSGQNDDCANGTTANAKITSQMKIQANFIGWSFESPNTWDIQSETYLSYPYPNAITYDAPETSPEVNPIPGLSIRLYAGGEGTVDSPYLIETKKHLDNVRQNLNKHFKQIEDIEFVESDFKEGGDYYDLGRGWKPIGDIGTKFTGVYDGDGHTISNLYTYHYYDSYLGLFGNIEGATCEIKNLALIDVNVKGASYLGGLVGEAKNSSSIKNCYTSGIITGYSYISYVGGLVGLNDENSKISHSFSNASCLGITKVGGLVGANKGGSTIDYSYSTGKVEAYTGDVGGLVGWNNLSSVSYCYSTGEVVGYNEVGGLIGWDVYSTYTSCFWDTETSKQSTSGGGTGKTTAEMKTAATFSDWDFDPPQDWNIQSGLYISYPYLQGISYDSPGATPEVNPIPGLADGCQDIVNVDASYTDQTSGWGVTHFSDLSLALSRVCDSGTVNIAHESITTFSEDVSFEGLNAVIGNYDFELTGNITGGLIRATNNGKLIIKSLTPGTAKIFPITDGTDNYTITIEIPTEADKDISMKISSKQVENTLTPKFVEIYGNQNLNATMTMRIDKAAIAPNTLGSTSNLRFFSASKNRYLPFDGDKVTIEEFDTYYIITLTGVNEF